MGEAPAAAPLVDCDVHAPPPGGRRLLPYLPPYWREFVTSGGFAYPQSVVNAYPRGAPTSGGWRAAGEELSPFELVRREVLERGGASLAVVDCFYGIESILNPDMAAVLASAVNDWLAAEWLAKEPRFRAGMVVTPHDPAAAAAEIERLASNPGFVQVFLPVRSAQPYGHRMYHPIHAAAQAHGLPVALHFGGMPGNPPTPSGWPTYYVEEYAGMAEVFQTQLISLVAQGVFERFPRLRVVLMESGFSWLPGLMWRLDKEWKGLRREVPWVKRPPSEYIREHVRATLQPLDLPLEGELVSELLEQVSSPDLLLYSSDFPHRHRDRPQAFLELLPEDLGERVRHGNAEALYRLASASLP
jgi:uncharacterized protein